MIVIVVANVFSFPSKKKKRNNHLHDWKDLDLKSLKNAMIIQNKCKCNKIMQKNAKKCLQ